MARQNNNEDETKRMQLQFEIYDTVQKRKKTGDPPSTRGRQTTRIVTRCKTNELCEHIISGRKERPFFSP